jgi:hypothetical protein
MFANGRGEIFQFFQVEFLARLTRVTLDQVDGDLGDTAFPASGFLTGGNEGIESFTEAGTWGHE